MTNHLRRSVDLWRIVHLVRNEASPRHQHYQVADVCYVRYGAQSVVHHYFLQVCVKHHNFLGRYEQVHLGTGL